MATIAMRKQRIGQVLLRMMLSIRAGARDSLDIYEFLKVTDPVRAEEALKRAVNMPLRIRDRVNARRTAWGMTAAVFNTELAACLAEAGSTTTVAELNAELTNLEDYANALLVRVIANESLDSIAADIAANLTDERADYAFPHAGIWIDQWK